MHERKRRDQARPQIRQGYLASPNLLSGAEWSLRVEKPHLAEARMQDKDGVKSVTIAKVSVPDPFLVRLVAKGDAPLHPGREYTLSFEARASTPRLVDASILDANGSPNAVKVLVPLYIRSRWERTVITCLCQSKRPLQGWELALELGRDVGDVEFRDVAWQEGVAEVGWTREFEHGLAVVNPTRQRQSFDGLAGFRKIRGVQDAGHNDGGEVEGRLDVPPSDAYLLQRIPRTR